MKSKKFNLMAWHMISFPLKMYWNTVSLHIPDCPAISFFSPDLYNKLLYVYSTCVEHDSWYMWDHDTLDPTVHKIGARPFYCRQGIFLEGPLHFTVCLPLHTLMHCFSSSNPSTLSPGFRARMVQLHEDRLSPLCQYSGRKKVLFKFKVHQIICRKQC